MTHPERTITVAHDMSKVSDTINIHKLIKKLLHTNFSDKIIRLSQTTARDANPTQHRNHTSSQRQFTISVPQGGAISPTLFNIYTADPKLTYSTHIHNISVQAHNTLQMIKVLTATGLGKKKDTLMANYKAVMWPVLKYASSIWSSLAFSTRINKLQVMQNAALRCHRLHTRHKHTTSA